MRTTEKAYKNALLTLLGVTRIVSRTDVTLPSKWLSVFENVRISSDILHTKLSTIDNEVEKEFREKEELVEKKFGKEKFYCEEELSELKDKSKEINIQIPKI